MTSSPATESVETLLRQVAELRAEVRALEDRHIALDAQLYQLDTVQGQLEGEVKALRAEHEKLDVQLRAVRYRVAGLLFFLARCVPGLVPLLRKTWHLVKRLSRSH